MLEQLNTLLSSETLSHYVNTNDWVWPVCEMIHYMGMSLIIGLIGLLDLRILGLFKGIPIKAFDRFVPIGIIAFLANLITGSIFIAGNPVGGAGAYLGNLSFQLKMGTLLLALINLVVFYYSGLHARAAATPVGGSAPTGAKVAAVVSITLWMFVIFFGRMLMYNDTLLLFLGM